jgi:hypothetical protein
MKRLYNTNINFEHYNPEKTEYENIKLDKEDMGKFKKLVFCLCWLHTVITERKKFKSLGWDVPYDFNDSDFNICKDIIANYIRLASVNSGDTGDKKDKSKDGKKRNDI